jgi:transposase
MTPRATDFAPPESQRAPKKRKKKIVISNALEQINHDAAGIDIGASEHAVAVPSDRDEVPVRCFGAFTLDLYKIANWLESCGIRTVAMESTGVFWIPLMEVLESRGFEVLLVDPHKLKNVSGRKSDMLDCQWIQQLHTYGLLRGAFRPSDEICALRSYVRQRSMLIRRGADHVQHMQKALTQMNVKLTMVLKDITGKTGMQIIRSILAGERDPKKLAEYRDPRCKHDEETIALALQGNWRAEHLFELRQAVELYDVFEEKIADCDAELARHLGTLPNAVADLLPLEKTSGNRASHPLAFDAYSELHRVTGVDLTAVPGIEAPTALAILGEIGTDMTRWHNDRAFACWLSLCPGTDISGGKRLSSRSKVSANRAAAAFRLAAYGAMHTKGSYISSFYHRMKGRMGPPKALTATAHKLARIVYAMLRDQTPYVEKGSAFYEERYKERRVTRLKRSARQLGFKLVAVNDPPLNGEDPAAALALAA